MTTIVPFATRTILELAAVGTVSPVQELQLFTAYCAMQANMLKPASVVAEQDGSHVCLCGWAP